MAVKRYNGSAWVTEAGGINSTLLQTKAATGLNVVIPSGATGGTVGVNGAVTIGSAVSSVVVDGAFSSTYDAYKIIISGGVCSTDNNSLLLRLGATTSGYEYSFGVFANSVSVGLGSTSATSFEAIGQANTNALSFNVEIVNPNLAKHTLVSAAGGYNRSNNNSRTAYQGVLPNTTQYTSFTILPASGTLTGGIIRIYGYNNG